VIGRRRLDRAEDFDGFVDDLRPDAIATKDREPKTWHAVEGTILHWMAGREGAPRRWLSGFGRFEWGADESGYASLLDALTRDRIELEAVEREISNPSSAAGDKLERDELAEARRELDEFRSALGDARRRSGGDERAEVPYDSRDRAQDAAADVLIQYVVRPGYAEVRTEEPEPNRYVYNIRVDWQRLGQLAREQGQTINF